jgi:hypothetical protein
MYAINVIIYKHISTNMPITKHENIWHTVSMGKYILSDYDRDVIVTIS